MIFVNHISYYDASAYVKIHGITKSADVSKRFPIETNWDKEKRNTIFDHTWSAIGRILKLFDKKIACDFPSLTLSNVLQLRIVWNLLYM